MSHTVARKTQFDTDRENSVAHHLDFVVHELYQLPPSIIEIEGG